jgi:hypothetical protein
VLVHVKAASPGGSDFTRNTGQELAGRAPIDGALLTFALILINDGNIRASHVIPPCCLSTVYKLSMPSR